MNETMNRIVIIGGPGTGKTTLANNLGKELNIPVYHLDGINHLKDWQKRDAKERDKIVLEIISNSKWITDGTYKTTLKQRIDRSDLVIFLDYSAITRVRGIISRYLQLNGKEKPEIPGCKEQLNISFIKFAINWNKIKRKAVDEILEKKKDKNILIFKNRRMLNRWYRKILNKKIIVKETDDNNQNEEENKYRRLSKTELYKSIDARSYYTQKERNLEKCNNKENKRFSRETLENER